MEKYKSYDSLLITKTRKKPRIIVTVFVVLCIAGIYIYDSFHIGKELDRYKEVSVYYNGIIFTQSHGKNLSDTGYYYGYKWQCVEYIKRFFYDAKNHAMPDLFGHAKDFFDPRIEQGQINESRGLFQYKNGYGVSPQPDDLLVFTDTKYGHVAIITEVTETYIEVIQQNVLGKTRDRLPLSIENGKYFVGSKRKPAGWLRLE